MRGRGRRPETPKRKADGAISRIALSEPLSWCSRTSVYAPLPDSGSFAHFIEISPSANGALSLHFIRILPSAHGRFRVLHPNSALSAWAFVRASPSTMSLSRRRNNENSECDVLRHDAHLFGVEPLTNAHSFGDVFEPDENFFGDGITRRSAKLAQRALAPALASRGALSERRATP